MPDGRLTLVVLGMMGRCPFAGQTWLYLNWLSGLRRLGHDVWYVEDDSAWFYDPGPQTLTDDPSYAARHLQRVLEPLGMGDRWALRFVDGRTDPTFGLSPARLDALYRDCDALLNIVGAVDLREVHLRAARRIYVQTDPVTAELRLANGDEHTREAFAAHDLIVTYGENYGAPDCGVPLDGFPYRFTRQPIDLDLWPMAFTPEARSFTTIGNYRMDGSDVTWNGDTYHWSKHHEWEKFLRLPEVTGQDFLVGMYPEREDDRRALTDHGWRLHDPTAMSLDPYGAYRRFIQTSRAEFTVAKDQNIRLRSGWFSERDACYLASGKPVIAQDTAFGCALPTGEGLFAVRTVDEAAAAVEAINADYRRHAEAARAIAEEHLAAERVAARLLADAELA